MNGTQVVGKVLLTNTILKKLELSGSANRLNTRKFIHKIQFILMGTDIKFGDIGAVTLSEALRTNTTLTELTITCKKKQKENNHFLSINIIQNI